MGIHSSLCEFVGSRVVCLQVGEVSDATARTMCEAQIYQRQLARHSPDRRHDVDLNASDGGDRRKGEACCLTGEKQRKKHFFHWAEWGGKRHHTLQ